jgi:hypothetical protein
MGVSKACQRANGTLQPGSTDATAKTGVCNPPCGGNTVCMGGLCMPGIGDSASPKASREQCDPREDPEMTAAEIRTAGATFHVESCAIKTDASGNRISYIYRIENRGESGLYLRWDTIGINIPFISPLPPKESFRRDILSYFAPMTVNTEMYIGYPPSKVSFPARVPQAQSRP